MGALIELDGVTKSFTVRERAGRLRRRKRAVRAVDGIDLEVEAGAAVGYIGPNGAGKSTTIKMLIGILVPTGGRVRVDGRDPSRRRVEVARRIGVVFGQRTQLWWDLPLGDSFDLLRHVYKVPAARYRATRDELVDLLDVGSFLATPVRQLSLGQRMRGEMVAALLHDPPILFLDEPTIGLDLVSKEAVRSFLATVNRSRGTTVLLTTHDLVDVERLCRRLVVIDGGRIIEDGTVEGVKARYGTERTLVVDLVEPGSPLAVGGAEVVRVDGPRQWLRFHREDHTAASLLAAVGARAAVRDVTIEEPAIDDVVARIYARGGITPGVPTGAAGPAPVVLSPRPPATLTAPRWPGQHGPHAPAVRRPPPYVRRAPHIGARQPPVPTRPGGFWVFGAGDPRAAPARALPGPAARGRPDPAPTRP